MAESVLVLGGGIGGVVAASLLRKKLPASHRVMLVEREARFVFAPSLLWRMTGGRTADEISRSVGRLARKGIEVVRGEVTRIDPEGPAAVVAGRTIEANRMVIALGAELAPEEIPGLAAAGHDFYTLAGAAAFHRAFAAFPGGALVFLTAGPVYRCPAAPYEAAMLLESACRRRKIRDRTRIALYAAEGAPMAAAGPAISEAVRRLVEEQGIAYHPGHQVAAADPAGRRLTFTNGVEVRYDLLAFVPPHRCPRAVVTSGLTDDGGWVPVDRRTLETRHPRLHALGDVTRIPLANGASLPKAGVFAQAQAEVVASNLHLAITGKGNGAAFDGIGECFIETGHSRAGLGRGDFYAEPAPRVTLYPPTRRWHVAKMLFEKMWLTRWM